MVDSENSIYLLDSAVELLATGPGEIKHRLLRAYSEKVSYVLEPSIAESLRPALLAIRAKLTRAPRYPGQSTTESALQHMPRKKASEIALQILELQRGVRSHASAA
jgi:hypothetical protein